MKLSVLDVAPIPSGTTAAEVLQRMGDLAQLADRLGYERYWVAEHHGLPSIASAAPEVLLAHLAPLTESIRLGPGGVMLPNHSPLAVAERYLTLEALHPGRIDLGLGRAAGTLPVTAHALRSGDPDKYPQQVAQLLAFGGDASFPEDHAYADIDVVPGGVELPPLWLLGSSGGSAELAGTVGAGYAFAAHFSPPPPGPAIRRYRETFQPSRHFDAPKVIVATSVFCADTEAEAQRLASSVGLVFVRLRTGNPGPIPSPEEAAAHPLTDLERRYVQPIVDLQIVGTPEQVREKLHALQQGTGADEIMVTTMMHDPEARLRSYELLAQVMDD
ncbi:MAG: 5,10-methylene tetrahydromethanopterin reductase [Sandaracinus sp.]|nr:5,10-methylene tetrahydromethanopterin reductase [Sandaracinus sp.]